MTAAEYAAAAIADLALGPMLTERARNILTGVVRRAMMEEREGCANAALLAIHSGGHGRDIVDAIRGRALP